MMNKKLQISLIVLATIILLLALAVPTLAGGREGNPYESCYIAPWYWYEGEADPLRGTYKVPGDLNAYYNEDDNLVNECTGIIPLGGRINNWATWLKFVEICNWVEGACVDTVFYVDYEDYPGTVQVFDPEDKGSYWTPIYSFTLYDNGQFVFVTTKVFDE